MENFDKLINEAIEKAIKERGHINILIAGRSGVGKSTLINSVFQSKLAETGQGKPVTKNTREITKEGVPLTIFDTRGLEMKDFESTLSELEKIIEDRCNDRDPNRHIHLAWLCIQEDGRRVEDAEIRLHELVSKRVPLIAVVTKSRSNQGFKQEVQNLLPQARNVMRVRAIAEHFDEEENLPPLMPMGLKELVDISSEVVPEGKRKALAAAQKANLDFKKSQAHKIVVGASTAAAAAGASPIPLSDVALLAPIQVGMIAGITSVFGVELSKATLSTLVSSAVGVTGASLIGRAVVSNLLKLIPGVGSIAGGAISAATATVLTVTLGEAYIAVLIAIFTEDPDASPDASEIGEKLKEKMKLSN